MSFLVAVEDGLTDVKQALDDVGIQVTKITSGTMNQVDAVVITGLSTNILGINDTNTRAPVIEAQGMTANEIVKLVQSRLTHKTE